jgi:hypothetical protein
MMKSNLRMGTLCTDLWKKRRINDDDDGDDNGDDDDEKTPN